MTIQEFVKENKIICEVKGIDQNPNMPEWNDAKHWQIILKRPNEFIENKYIIHKLIIYFSQGLGIKNRPTVEDVLDCLASDSASVENTAMDDWIMEMGYGTEGMKEIRKAEKIYRVCQEQAEKLQEFLGNEEYKKLLWDVERL